MALLMMEGFEDNRVPAGWSGEMQFVTGASSGVDYVGGRTGGTCWRVWSNYGSWKRAWLTFTPLSDFTVGLAVNGNFVAGSTILYFYETSGTVIHFSLALNSDGYLTVMSNGVVLATSASKFSSGAGIWNHYAVRATISDTVGKVTVWVNGVKIIDVSNVDTKNAGSTGTVSVLRVGDTSGSGYGYGGYPYLYIDDFWLTDTTGPAPYNGSLGDCVIEAYRPSADGDSSQWVGSDGNTVANWQLVDDVATTTDYVGSVNVGDRDLYNIPDAPADPGTVLAVQQKVVAAKASTGPVPGVLTIDTKAGSGTLRKEDVANNLNLTTTYSWFDGALWTTDPDGAAWTPAALNALQIGYEIT